jgi:hypothetical protein
MADVVGRNGQEALWILLAFVFASASNYIIQQSVTFALASGLGAAFIYILLVVFESC